MIFYYHLHMHKNPNNCLWKTNFPRSVLVRNLTISWVFWMPWSNKLVSQLLCKVTFTKTHISDLLLWWCKITHWRTAHRDPVKNTDFNRNSARFDCTSSGKRRNVNDFEVVLEQESVGCGFNINTENLRGQFVWRKIHIVLDYAMTN